jgi:hypothetical protein
LTGVKYHDPAADHAVGERITVRCPAGAGEAIVPGMLRTRVRFGSPAFDDEHRFQ